MFYETPVWSGLQGKLAIQPNQSKANYVAQSAATANVAAKVNENPSAWSASLAWTGMGGRARAFLANMRAKDFTAVGNTDSGYTAGGGYNFGPVDIGLAYERYSYQTATGESRAKEWAIGVAVPLGPGKIGASYANASDLSGSGSPGTNNGAKMWNIGYEWTLSKRTNLGFGIAKIDNGTTGVFTWTGSIPTQNGFTSGAAAAGQDQTNIFVSMRHSF
jgi:predicted porin